MPKGQDLSRFEAKLTQDLWYHSKGEMAQSHWNSYGTCMVPKLFKSQTGNGSLGCQISSNSIDDWIYKCTGMVELNMIWSWLITYDHGKKWFSNLLVLNTTLDITIVFVPSPSTSGAAGVALSVSSSWQFDGAKSITSWWFQSIWKK